MLKYDIIRPESHEAWLQERNKGIGSSEAATVCGLEFYKQTPTTIWQRKKGLGGIVKENSSMTAGHEFEPCVPFMFARRTGSIIDPTSEGDWIAADKQMPFLRVSPDRLFYPKDTPSEKQTYENAFILECKTSRYNIDKNNLPLYWRIQVQYQMAVMGIKMAVIGWISYANDLVFDYAVVRHNEDMWQYIKSHLVKFWNDNVLGNKMPDTILNNDDALKHWPQASNEKQCTADKQMIDEYGRYCLYKKQAKECKECIDDIEMKVKSFMQDATVMNDEEGKTLFQWSNVNTTEGFQMDKFKEEHPDIYQQYVTPAGTSRRFSVKLPKTPKAAKAK